MRLLKNGAMDMAKLMLCMVLAVDDRLNSKIRYAYKIENIYAELCQDSLLNRKFISYGPYFMNAIIVLYQLNCIKNLGNDIYIVDNVFGNEVKTHSRRMVRVFSASDNIIRLFSQISTSEMFNRLRIQL